MNPLLLSALSKLEQAGITDDEFEALAAAITDNADEVSGYSSDESLLARLRRDMSDAG